MTVTITFLHSTRNHMVYSAVHDGGGGDVDTITNSGAGTPDFQTDILFAPPDSSINQGPLKPMFDTVVADDAAAQRLLQQLDPGIVTLVPNSTAAPSGWSASAAEAANRATLVITGTTAVASSCLIYVSRPQSFATP